MLWKQLALSLGLLPAPARLPPPAELDASKRGGICWQMDGKTRPPSVFADQTEDCLLVTGR